MFREASVQTHRNLQDVKPTNTASKYGSAEISSGSNSVRPASAASFLAARISRRKILCTSGRVESSFKTHVIAFEDVSFPASVKVDIVAITSSSERRSLGFCANLLAL